MYYNCTPEQFNWKYRLKELCKDHHKKFDEWYDSELVFRNLTTQNIKKLFLYCSKHFIKWYNPKIEKSQVESLCLYCSKDFLLWWEPELHKNKNYMKWYCICLNKYIKYWWDLEKTFNSDYENRLYLYCSKQKHIWEDEYIVQKFI